MSAKRRLLPLIGMIPLIGIGAASLLDVANSYRRDYHWTAGTLPLDARQGRFEVYVRGTLLDRALDDGELAIRSGDTWTPLAKAEVTVRLNQVERVTRTPLVTGVACLAVALGMIVAVFAFVREKGPPGLESGVPPP